jgi:hypothetical protein
MKGIKMKKTLIYVLSLTLVFSCVAAFAFTASASDYGYVDMRPVEGGDAQFTANGATVETDGNGTATITLTAATADITMVYKSNGAIYHEAYVDISAAKYVKYFYALSSSSMTLDIHAHYDRGNKNDADLYLSGMVANPTYFKLSGANYGVWDMYQYLSERDGYLPTDNIIKFSDIVYTVTGNIGDTVTIYYFEVADSYDDDFGTVIPDNSTVEVSEEASETESAAVSEEISEASAEQSVVESAETSQTETPSTGDTGIIAIAIVSVIALAGAVVIKKK